MSSSASARRQPARRPNPITAALVNAYRQLFGPSDWLMLIIACGLILMPVLTLYLAELSLEPGVVTAVGLLGIAFGFVMARSRFNEFIGLLIMTLIGSGMTVIVAGFSVEGGASTVIQRGLEWFNDAITGGVNQDALVFTLLVSLLMWFLAYNTAWHIFRVDRPWRAILPPALVIVLNAVFYAGDNNLDGYLYVFLFCALIALARSALEQREWEWFNNGVRVPRRLRRQFLTVGTTLAALMVLLAWFLPVSGLDERLKDFQEFLRSDPLTEISEVWNRLFAPIAPEGPTSADYYGGDQLELSGAIQLGDQTILAVQASNDRRYYWRSRVFDTYELGQWQSGAEIRLTTPYSPFVPRVDYGQARAQVTMTYTVGARSLRIVHTAPQPAQIDLETRTDLTYLNDSDAPPMNISAIRPLSVLQRGATYTATSLVSVATADQLRAAGSDYPEWIVSHPQYLRTTPNVISDRAEQLAAQIVAEAGAANSYDKAKAIERWLRENIEYNQSIPEPPVGLDPIDWFLFDLKQGYCNYYATAMVVMLRSQGSPRAWPPASRRGRMTARSASTSSRRTTRIRGSRRTSRITAGSSLSRPRIRRR
ncbi:MAG: transglutaminase domain-containing protein [Chloroflexi bacterium]|nr:transglutaminase domain-containing protein [Chloroflexota bacterium]